ncbi:DsbA family oxidoreductase [Tepidamorphus sp. 3E244]|uniref:DsbA family oxidoreductase n=1 Tax=Tepidamorphus sp. 3E244 TaxID=3385498 RepID=UPI0038FC5DE7
MEKLTIDVVSDVMCPWCYIGKKRLDAALAQRPDVPVDIRWRAYKLDPTIPEGGVDRDQYLSNKFGDRAKAIYAQIEDAGRAEGIDFNFAGIERSPNTTNAHRLIRWAYGQDAQGEVVEGLFRAYFVEGGDVEKPESLSKIATDAGMDAALVSDLLNSDADKQAVDEEVAQAHQIGIQGVPCFIFGARLAVMGAQAPEILVDTIDKALSGEMPEPSA